MDCEHLKIYCQPTGLMRGTKVQRKAQQRQNESIWGARKLDLLSFALSGNDAKTSKLFWFVLISTCTADIDVPVEK
jgi:hypothetical protein